MAYTLVAWIHPDASQDTRNVIEAQFDQSGAIQFLPGLRLYHDGEWNEVRDAVANLVTTHTGMRAVVVMPSAGSPVEGWVTAEPDRMDDIQGSMNEPGNDDYPILHVLRGE